MRGIHQDCLLPLTPSGFPTLLIIHQPTYTASGATRSRSLDKMSKYEIKLSPGKGKGLFATVPLERGDVIFKERQVMAIDEPSYRVTEKAVKQAFDRLSKADQRHFLQLNESIAHAGKSRLFRIFKNSAFNDTHGSWMTFAVAWINHSCVPNATISNGDGSDELIADNTIAEGDEIFISYKADGFPIMGVKQRKDMLRNTHGFECSCPLCAAESEALAISEMRRDLMRSLWYPVNGRHVPDLTSLGSSFTLRTPEDCAKMSKLVKKVDKPLGLEQKTIYYFLLAKLQEAEGVASLAVAEAYSNASYRLYTQLSKMRDIVILQTARYVRDWFRRALELTGQIRGPLSADMQTLKRDWIDIQRDFRILCAAQYVGLEHRKHNAVTLLTAQQLDQEEEQLRTGVFYDTMQPFALYFPGGPMTTPQPLTEERCKALLRQRAGL